MVLVIILFPWLIFLPTISKRWNCESSYKLIYEGAMYIINFDTFYKITMMILNHYWFIILPMFYVILPQGSCSHVLRKLIAINSHPFMLVSSQYILQRYQVISGLRAQFLKRHVKGWIWFIANHSPQNDHHFCSFIWDWVRDRHSAAIFSFPSAWKKRIKIRAPRLPPPQTRWLRRGPFREIESMMYWNWN